MTTLKTKRDHKSFSNADADLIISGVPLAQVARILKRTIQSVNCGSARIKAKRKAKGLPTKKFNNHNRPSVQEQAKIITNYHLAKASENEQARNKKIESLKTEVLVRPKEGSTKRLTKIKVPILPGLEIAKVNNKHKEKVLTHKFRINGVFIEVDNTAVDIHIGHNIMEVNF